LTTGEVSLLKMHECLATCNCVYIGPTYLGFVSTRQKLDSIQIESTVPDKATDPHRFVTSGLKKFNLNMRSQGKVRDGKQAHPNITEIDAQTICLRRLREDLHGGIQQLALLATPVLEVGLDRHP
jgi:hypothetical protein